MKELIEYIAKELVEQPEQVRIRRRDTYYSSIFSLQVAPGDMGKIIGKQGRVANAMRTLLKVAAMQEGKRVILEIERRTEHDDDQPEDTTQQQIAPPPQRSQPRAAQQMQNRPPFRRGGPPRGPRGPRWNGPRS